MNRKKRRLWNVLVLIVWPTELSACDCEKYARRIWLQPEQLVQHSLALGSHKLRTCPSAIVICILWRTFTDVLSRSYCELRRIHQTFDIGLPRKYTILDRVLKSRRVFVYYTPYTARSHKNKYLKIQLKTKTDQPEIRSVKSSHRERLHFGGKGLQNKWVELSIEEWMSVEWIVIVETERK